MRQADGATRAEDPGSSVVAATDPAVALGLLIAALGVQQRTTLALYCLVRSMNEATAAPRRRRVRRRPMVTAGARAMTGGRENLGRASLCGEASVDSSPRHPALKVHCFGHFEVLRQGVPIARWRRGKAKLLLKCLVARRQPISRDTLLDLLWPDADPSTAVNGLRVALHALRQALGSCGGPEGGPDDGREASVIISEGGTYRLNPTLDLWVDADEFDRHFASGLRLERNGQVAEAIAHYEQAESVYRDDYLLEDLYEDWTLVRREELKDQYLLVLTKLADACFQRGDAEGCIVRCHKILQRDACREDAYQRLMRCYLRLGQRSQALHWFELCEQTLRRELDVAPSDQTAAIYHEIMARKRLDRLPRDARARAVTPRPARPEAS